MKKVLSLAIFIQITLVGICGVRMVQAQDNDATERRAKPVLSNNIYRNMNKVQEAIQAEDYATALSELDALLARGDRLQGYDRAKTLHLKTIVFIRQENYPQAVTTCKQAIATRALELTTEQDLRYTLVRMLFVLERYDEALQELETWLAEIEGLSAEAAFTAAQLYLTLDKLPQAQQYAEQGMALHQAEADVAPRENWYRMLLSIYGRQKNYQQAIVIAEQTLSFWPDKLEYYHQLSGLYQQIDQQKRAWAILDIAYHNDLFTDANDYNRLLQMHRYFAYPQRGARIFATAMENSYVDKNSDNWESLANAWLQARQWQQAESALVAAAQLSDNGERWLRLCQIAFQNQQWQQSLNYCNNALDQGGLAEDRGTVWQLMAQVNYTLDNYTTAAGLLEKCSEVGLTQQDCQSRLEHVKKVIAFKAAEKAHADEQVRQLEERRLNRDTLIDSALLMTE